MQPKPLKFVQLQHIQLKISLCDVMTSVKELSMSGKVLNCWCQGPCTLKYTAPIKAFPFEESKVQPTLYQEQITFSH